jgi:phosphate transport system substrate-binding protein
MEPRRGTRNEEKRLKNIITGFLALAALAGGAASATDLNGAGSTFGAPIYQKWAEEFKASHPSIQINYQSIGSGGGIRQLISATVDFGATDMPMTDEQMAQVKNAKVLHFPTVLGADVPSYNVAGVKPQLKFSPETLAGIFLGKITRWNDDRIKRENPGVNLPSAAIMVIHRSDGSGTTFVWTDYLSKVSSEWKSRVGANTSVNWPVGLGAKGNEGVAGLIKQTPNSIGYVELIFAIQNHMGYGLVRNSAGAYVDANLASVTAAAAGAAKNMPADFRVSITNPPGKDSYPIASFTWLLVPDSIPNPAKRADLKSFLRWMLTSGQSYCAALAYAPLPKQVVAKEMKLIDQIH